MPVASLSAAAQRMALASVSWRPATARMAAGPGVAGLAAANKPAAMGARHQRGAARGLAVKASMADDVRAKNAKYPVIVYSKTYCPYCTEVKSLLKGLAVPATVVELDTLADGDAVQAGVAEVTGRRTVPQVFIGGKHVGGCDDTVAAHKSGKLKEMLAGVGIAV